ncbi:hypothetical protein [Salinilacihabitans rarus]|uniref:hypothetical protein n=1 Tax=Salinilacihabitans rarus TaxID=2961596 RepID=UPI0020C8FBB2|nr:hypothetical protein [Salinilacihabitans rarus]
MSVFRPPGVLGRTTRRRLVGVGAAASAAAAEAVGVGAWFTLVVVGPRTTSTALAGLGILFCGSLLRAGVFGATTSAPTDPLQPRRLAAALALAGTWHLWLLVAEVVGGTSGLVAGGAVLTAVLAGQFVLERRVFGSRRPRGGPVHAVGPALLVAVGATTLLAATWFIDWTVTTAPLSVGPRSLVVRIEAFQVGLVVFAAFAFLAQQRRFQRTLAP